jgi:hypothetical protein
MIWISVSNSANLSSQVERLNELVCTTRDRVRGKKKKRQISIVPVSLAMILTVSEI